MFILAMSMVMDSKKSNLMPFLGAITVLPTSTSVSILYATWGHISLLLSCSLSYFLEKINCSIVPYTCQAACKLFSLGNCHSAGSQLIDYRLHLKACNPRALQLMYIVHKPWTWTGHSQIHWLQKLRLLCFKSSHDERKNGPWWCHSKPKNFLLYLHPPKPMWQLQATEPSHLTPASPVKTSHKWLCDSILV